MLRGRDARRKIRGWRAGCVVILICGLQAGALGVVASAEPWAAPAVASGVALPGGLVSDPILAAVVREDEPHEAHGLGLYKTYCAACHGPSAKGDGPLGAKLRARPADLTHLARVYGVPLPRSAIINSVLDARMPGVPSGNARICRGHNFGWVGVMGSAAEAFQRGIVLEVLTYLETIQAPDKVAVDEARKSDKAAFRVR